MNNVKELHAVTLRNVLVKMSDGSLIQGKVNVPDQHRRLSDWFRNSTNPFIVVVSENTIETPRNFYH